MSCFTKITQDLTELNHYEEIKKLSEISNKILKNGVEHVYEEKKLEATFGSSNFEFLPEKSKKGLSLQAFKFFDYVTKRKRLVFVYLPYEELKIFGLKFDNKKKDTSMDIRFRLKKKIIKFISKKNFF